MHFFINDRCTRCSQSLDTWDSYSMNEIIWFPEKFILHSCPIGTECLRTHVKRPQGWLTFISISILNGSLCRLLYNRVSECRPFYFDSRNAPGGDRRGSPSSIRSRTVRTSVLSTVALHFFHSCLMPRGRENEIIMLRGAQFAAELLCAFNVFCRISSAFLFKNSSILDARNFRKNIEKMVCVILCMIQIYINHTKS